MVSNKSSFLVVTNIAALHLKVQLATLCAKHVSHALNDNTVLNRQHDLRQQLDGRRPGGGGLHGELRVSWFLPRNAL